MENVRSSNKKIGLNTLISWGATVVIVGLTFKILHWEGGEWMIAIGLLTEACLFFLLGYAALSNGDSATQVQQATVISSAAARNMEDLLSSSIDQQVIEKLKGSFDRFSKTVESVNSITDSTKTTQEMVREIEGTTREVQLLRKNLEELNIVYKAQLDAFRKS